MSHLVSSSAPIASAHTVKRYAGFGILGADIPTTGDNGGSPVLNDGISPTSEYHWRVETAPSDGVLTIYPDLTFEWDGSGVTDGSYPWVYRLFEDGSDDGTATVQQTLGSATHNVTVANSQQANSTSAAAIRQTHLLGVAGAQQTNQSSVVSIRQTHRLGIASSQQINTSVAGSVSQSAITFIAGSNSIQINQAVAAAIWQTHLLTVANSQSINTGSVAAIWQTHLLTVTNSQSINTGSVAAILQIIVGDVIAANSQQVNQSSAGSIKQTHLIGVANSQQVNQAIAAAISSGSFSGSISDADIARIAAAVLAALNATTIPVDNDAIAANVLATLVQHPNFKNLLTTARFLALK